MKIAVKSYGCAENHAEGEIIAGILGKDKIAGQKEAEVIVLNICTVKGNQTALREIRKVKQEYPEKRIVVAGCVPEDMKPDIKKIAPDASIINTHNILEIESAVNSNNYESFGFGKHVKINLPRIRINPVVGIVPICQGCLDACGFCSTRLVKGILYSYPEESIVQEVKDAVADGCREVWLTGQDTACYGFDRKTNLPELLRKLCAIEGDFMIRLGMGNPRHVPRYMSELISAFRHEKMFKFLHVPVQSGNDSVLQRMRRGHNVGTVKGVVQAFRSEIPQMTFSTDVIVGFPDETDAEFDDSLKVIEELRFDVVNISRFVARKSTPAYLMADLPGGLKKDRSRLMTMVAKRVARENNEKWVGWKGNIVIDEKGPYGGSVGRNSAYKPVVIKDRVELGCSVGVRIISATERALYGEIVSGALF